MSIEVRRRTVGLWGGCLGALALVVGCAVPDEDVEGSTESSTSSESGADSTGDAELPCEAGPSLVQLDAPEGRPVGRVSSAAGDVDGDGRLDVAVALPIEFEPLVPQGTDEVRVSFGGWDVEQQAMADAPGFSILEDGDSQHLSEVSIVGDVNGDGLADILVGATRTCFNDVEKPELQCNEGPWRSYVVFGKADSAPMMLADVASGMGGFMITHPEPNGLAYQTFTPLGDLNGDSRADFAISSPVTGVHVVFGKADADPLSLSSLGEGGYSIEPPSENGFFGTTVMSVGDVNGDGLGDLAIGSTGADDRAGRVHVVFSASEPVSLSMDDIDAGRGRGFVIVGEDDGTSNGGELGSFIAAAGDMNGDGFADVAVSAPRLNLEGEVVPQGRAYVVFGKPGTEPVHAADLSMGRGGGFAITGEWSGGKYVSGGGGDIDGDGAPDILVGTARDRVAIISGRADVAPVVVGSTDAPWVSLDIPEGLYVRAVVGDLGCDGLDDVVLSSESTDDDRPRLGVIYN